MDAGTDIGITLGLYWDYIGRMENEMVFGSSSGVGILWVEGTGVIGAPLSVCRLTLNALKP